MRLWYQSSYDRGLEHLLGMWPQIRGKYPDTELWIAYGWNVFDSFFADNPERMAWKDKMETLMKQEGITHYGKVGKTKLQELRKQCDIWAYPTHFPEINCMSGLECQRDGVVPCVINFAALQETVQSGYKVNGDIYDQETKDRYLASLLELMGNKKVWAEEQKRGKEFAKQYCWSKIAPQWEHEFEA